MLFPCNHTVSRRSSGSSVALLACAVACVVIGWAERSWAAYAAVADTRVFARIWANVNKCSLAMGDIYVLNAFRL